MPVPVIDPQKRSGAYKKVSPVAGIAEQGLGPDPDVMHTLFSRLFAIPGPVGILPVIFAVNSVRTAAAKTARKAAQAEAKAAMAELVETAKAAAAAAAAAKGGSHHTGQR